jgi:glycosyltransferase involved in cell wall biosynthesis
MEFDHALLVDQISEKTSTNRVAVLIPCHNEALTIGKVIADFRSRLPEAQIYVYDNNSTDGTAAAALVAGAEVRSERLQGKGNVVRRMFADVEAEIYVLVDGDDTYEPHSIAAMVELLRREQLDMVTGARLPSGDAAFRPGHRVGNFLLTRAVAWTFGNRVSDMLSGFRVFSRRFVKSFPALSAGFETETEFTIHALELRMPVGELPVAYRERPAGSASKLRTVGDGIRILRTILLLIKEERPLHFFGLAACVLLAIGLALGVPVILEFLRTGLVPRLPTAILATGFVLLSFLSLFGGLILDSVARGRKEMKRLFYLTVPGIGATDRQGARALRR